MIPKCIKLYALICRGCKDACMKRTALSQGQWCLANPMAENRIALQSMVEHPMEQNTLINHASVAMNLYFQTTGRLQNISDFNNNSGLIANL